jgi:hypothetical protein
MQILIILIINRKAPKLFIKDEKTTFHIKRFTKNELNLTIHSSKQNF